MTFSAESANEKQAKTALPKTKVEPAESTTATDAKPKKLTSEELKALEAQKKVNDTNRKNLKERNDKDDADNREFYTQHEDKFGSSRGVAVSGSTTRAKTTTGGGSAKPKVDKPEEVKPETAKPKAKAKDVETEEVGDEYAEEDWEPVEPSGKLNKNLINAMNIHTSHYSDLRGKPRNLPSFKVGDTLSSAMYNIEEGEFKPVNMRSIYQQGIVDATDRNASNILIEKGYRPLLDNVGMPLNVIRMFTRHRDGSQKFLSTESYVTLLDYMFDTVATNGNSKFDAHTLYDRLVYFGTRSPLIAANIYRPEANDKDNLDEFYLTKADFNAISALCYFSNEALTVINNMGRERLRIPGLQDAYAKHPMNDRGGVASTTSLERADARRKERQKNNNVRQSDLNKREYDAKKNAAQIKLFVGKWANGKPITGGSELSDSFATALDRSFEQRPDAKIANSDTNYNHYKRVYAKLRETSIFPTGTPEFNDEVYREFMKEKDYSINLGTSASKWSIQDSILERFKTDMFQECLKKNPNPIASENAVADMEYEKNLSILFDYYWRDFILKQQHGKSNASANSTGFINAFVDDVNKMPQELFDKKIEYLKTLSDLKPKKTMTVKPGSFLNKRQGRADKVLVPADEITEDDGAEDDIEASEEESNLVEDNMTVESVESTSAITTPREVAEVPEQLSAMLNKHKQNVANWGLEENVVKAVQNWIDYLFRLNWFKDNNTDVEDYSDIVKEINTAVKKITESAKQAEDPKTKVLTDIHNVLIAFKDEWDEYVEEQAKTQTPADTRTAAKTDASTAPTPDLMEQVMTATNASRFFEKYGEGNVKKFIEKEIDNLKDTNPNSAEYKNLIAKVSNLPYWVKK